MVLQQNQVPASRAVRLYRNYFILTTSLGGQAGVKAGQRHGRACFPSVVLILVWSSRLGVSRG
jgi:hypothetical protein